MNLVSHKFLIHNIHIKTMFYLYKYILNLFANVATYIMYARLLGTD